LKVKSKNNKESLYTPDQISRSRQAKIIEGNAAHKNIIEIIRKLPSLPSG
jgi:hypothetical protein